ncbi:helix-turn-helix domain-containing protein [Streptomyces poriferorum]|uniref:Helix-turn-helix domain-containing protein n=1 Tax=Streptomyces poriferorum TaxID=2798799 RepID=A0ABY9IWI1_9ACTN|nr:MULTISPECIES: helix-turn-helix domain-containing protein [unclassified Streptomyces]MDP5311234.1 helix-turn-helix domain-containing protein [Streptomyces sp. Alt4]WLQ59655.1 helix-turn-helix domain-containing protein [Streptomyces sp. Alt2]
MLETLGLSNAESQVYQLLVRAGRADADRIHYHLSLSAGHAAEAVDGLVEKGLVTVTDELPAQLIPSPPDIAGEVLLMARMNELKTARGALDRLAGEYHRAPRAEGTEGMAEVTSEAEVALRYQQIQRTARQEVVRFDAPPYLVSEPVNGVELERLAAGVTYRTVYDRMALERDGAQKEIRQYTEAGERARVLHHVPVKMIIVDGSTALLAVRTGASRRQTVVHIYAGPLLDALVALFEMAWESALPLHPTADQSRCDLAGEDIELLTLLLAGLTDLGIARQLRIGRRTVQRRVRELMDRAAASSRIELGWRAARLGWIVGPGDQVTPPESLPETHTRR